MRAAAKHKVNTLTPGVDGRQLNLKLSKKKKMTVIDINWVIVTVITMTGGNCQLP